MCGIAGIHAYHYAANGVDRAELVRMRDHMAARGPDGQGLWLSADARIGLAHRRLAIIDLTENGAQPMQSEDGRLVVSFNGEIYNHIELRAELTAKGHRFRTASDTEVLLQLYADRGADMLPALRGMFAFALWDQRDGSTLLARDPYGIKPLYYADDGWTCRFASQVKALLAGGSISNERDPAGQVGFYLLGSVPEPFTSHRAIRAVPAGTSIRIDRTGPGPAHRYHSIADVYCRAEQEGSLPGGKPAAGQDAAEVRAALVDSVRAHLVADVPVGAFLSAGIDSGALVGLMRDAGASDIQTVTIAFEEYAGGANDEAPLAAEVARQYATRHTSRVVTRAEFEADLPRIVEAMDQPSIDGINTWFVAKATREQGLKVAISGLGGDELLGGYPSFKDLPRWVATFGLPSRIPWLGSTLRRLMSGVLAPALGLNPKAAGLVELGGDYAGAYLLRRGLFLPWELSQTLDPATIAEGLRRLSPLRLIRSAMVPCPRRPFARVATLEASLYMRNQLLRDTDWASMAHALEVRVPLVDSLLLARMAPLLSARSTTAAALDGKRLLAEAPSRPLPTAITHRAKTGFTTPVGSWMQSRDASARHGSGLSRGAGAAPWARDWSHVIGDKFQVGA